MSGDFYVGMSGPGAAIELTLPAPSGVDFTATTTRALSVTFRQAGSVSSTVTTWAITGITATSLVATKIPAGTEITKVGAMRIDSTLTLDGVAYRYKTLSDTVKANP